MEISQTFLKVFASDLAYLSPILTGLVVFILGTGLAIGKIEGWTGRDSIYHAFINATTVGYGDLRPTRDLSKLLSVVNAFAGLLLTGVFVGIGVHSVQTAIAGFQ